MILWVIFGLMTAAAIAAVLLPLVRRRAKEFSGNDIAVYRDQLGELDRDRAAGLIGKSEAEAARVEISRRLLAAADADAARAASAAADPVPAARVRRCIIAATGRGRRALSSIGLARACRDVSRGHRAARKADTD
jgi:cytochrome c-type biogenesis protein CcmH